MHFLKFALAAGWMEHGLQGPGEEVNQLVWVENEEVWR